MGFTNVGDTPDETTQFKPQALDETGTSQASIPPSMSRPLTFRSAPIGYALVPQSFFVKVKKRLGPVEAKVKLIEEGLSHGFRARLRIR